MCSSDLGVVWCVCGVCVCGVICVCRVRNVCVWCSVCLCVGMHVWGQPSDPRLGNRAINQKVAGLSPGCAK